MKTLENPLLTFTMDDDCCVRAKNAKTIQRYISIKGNEVKEPSCYEYDCFFAFSNEQFDEGLKKIRPLKEGEKPVSVGFGLYGTKDGVDSFLNAMKEASQKRRALIKENCVPQEVYLYEYNNHECMYDYDGDYNAVRVVIETWNEQVARGLKRLSDYLSFEEIIKKMEDE